MLIEGEKIHIVERRYFETDVRRHFCGTVMDCENNLLRIKGYIWVMDSSRNIFVKKSGERERIIYLGERLTMNVLPANTNIESVVYKYDKQTGHTVTDGKEFSINIAEIGVAS